jgi:ATP-dependent DNA helicase RecQ
VNPPQIDLQSDTVTADTLAPVEARIREPHKARKWVPDDPARVPRYGAGEVALASGEHIAVQFPDGRTRTFMSTYVRAARRGSA